MESDEYAAGGVMGQTEVLFYHLQESRGAVPPAIITSKRPQSVSIMGGGGACFETVNFIVLV